MKEFLRPTKATWWVFVLVILAINLGIPVANTGLSSIPLYEVFGLLWIFQEAGANVCSGGELICNPNTIGWFLVALSTVFWLFVHYLLASLISKKIMKSRKEKIIN